MYIYGDNGVKILLPSGGGGVGDVQIAHNSIVDDYGVAQIPYATYSNLGMVRPYSNEYASGLYINTYSGDLSISPATLSMIQAAPPDSDVKCPIIPANQHQAVFYGLAKAAGDTYQGGSGYPVGQYVPPAKEAIRNMIGAEAKKGEWVLKGTLTVENALTGVSVDLSGCTELVIKGPITGTGASYLYSLPSNKLLIDGISVNGNRLWYSYFIDVNGDTIPVISKYEASDTGSIHINNNAYVVLDYKIKNITTFALGRIDTVTSCNIEIWAR